MDHRSTAPAERERLQEHNACGDSDSGYERNSMRVRKLDLFDDFRGTQQD
jgi:hypothetical protein